MERPQKQQQANSKEAQSPIRGLKSPQKSKKSETEPTQHNLFVGGLNQDTTSETILEYFSQFGKIKDVNLIIDWVTNKSKRCAIIFCENSKTRNKILRRRNHKIDGKFIRCNKADNNKKGTKIIKTNKLFIGNIHPSINRSQLLHHFSKYGKIESLKLIKNTSRSKHSEEEIPNQNHCLIDYSLEKTAKMVLDCRDEHEINGFKLTCSPFKSDKQKKTEQLKLKLKGQLSDSKALSSKQGKKRKRKRKKKNKKGPGSSPSNHNLTDFTDTESEGINPYEFFGNKNPEKPINVTREMIDQFVQMMNMLQENPDLFKDQVLNMESRDKNIPAMQQFMRFSQAQKLQSNGNLSTSSGQMSRGSHQITENTSPQQSFNPHQSQPSYNSSHSQSGNSFENTNRMGLQEAYSPYKPQHNSFKQHPNYQDYNPLNEYIQPTNPFTQNQNSQGYLNPPTNQNLQQGNFSKKPFEIEFYQEQGSSNFTGSYNSRVQHGFRDLNYDYGYQQSSHYPQNNQYTGYTRHQQGTNGHHNIPNPLNNGSGPLPPGLELWSDQNPSGPSPAQNDFGYLEMNHQHGQDPELTEEEQEEDRLLREAFMN